MTPSAQQDSSRFSTHAASPSQSGASTTPQFPAVQTTPPADTAQYAQVGLAAEGPPGTLDSPHLFPLDQSGVATQPVSFKGPGEANGDAAPRVLPVEQMPDPHLLQEEQMVWDNDAFSTTSGLPSRQESQHKELSLSPWPDSASLAALQADLEAARAQVQHHQDAALELESEAASLRSEVSCQQLLQDAVAMLMWLLEEDLEVVSDAC